MDARCSVLHAYSQSFRGNEYVQCTLYNKYSTVASQGPIDETCIITYRNDAGDGGFQLFSSLRCGQDQRDGVGVGRVP